MYVCIYNYAGQKRCCPLVSSNLVSNRGSEIIVALHPFLSEDLYRRRRNGQWKQHTDLLYTYTWNIMKSSSISFTNAEKQIYKAIKIHKIDSVPFELIVHLHAASYSKWIWDRSLLRHLVSRTSSLKSPEHIPSIKFMTWHKHIAGVSENIAYPLIPFPQYKFSFWV